MYVFFFLHSWSKSPVQKRMFGRLTIVAFYDYTVDEYIGEDPGAAKAAEREAKKAAKAGK